MPVALRRRAARPSSVFRRIPLRRTAGGRAACNLDDSERGGGPAQRGRTPHAAIRYGVGTVQRPRPWVAAIM